MLTQLQLCLRRFICLCILTIVPITQRGWTNWKMQK